MVELFDSNLSFLKFVIREQAPIDLLPGVADFQSEFRVECSSSFGIDFVETDRCMGFRLVERRHTFLEILPRLVQLVNHVQLSHALIFCLNDR